MNKPQIICDLMFSLGYAKSELNNDKFPSLGKICNAIDLILNNIDEFIEFKDLILLNLDELYKSFNNLSWSKFSEEDRKTEVRVCNYLLGYYDELQKSFSDFYKKSNDSHEDGDEEIPQFIKDLIKDLEKDGFKTKLLCVKMEKNNEQ